jgi:hypothetical protein
MLPAIILSLVSVDIQTVKSTVENGSTVYDATLPQLCGLLNSAVYDFFEEAKRAKKCVDTNKHQHIRKQDDILLKDAEMLLEYFECLGLEMKTPLKCNENAFSVCENISRLFCDMRLEIEIRDVTEMLHKIDCIWCLSVHSRETLADTVSISELYNVLHTELIGNSSQCTHAYIRRIVLVLRVLTQRLTKHLTSSCVECFLNVDDWGYCLNASADTLIDILDSLPQSESEDYVITYDEIILGIKCIFIIVVTSFVGNWALLLIFLEHTEFYNDPALIIVILVVAHTASSIFGSIVFIFSQTSGTYGQSDSSSTVFLILWSAMTLFSVHVMTKVGMKKYFSLLSTDSLDGQVGQRVRKFFVYAFWLLSRVAHVQVPALYMVNVYRYLRVQSLLSCIACSLLLLIALTTISVATSLERRCRILLSSGQIMKSYLVGNITFILAFIIIVISKYTPFYILDCIEDMTNIFKYVSMETASAVSFSVIVINSFLNPIVIYEMSSTFRRFFNKLCHADTKERHISTI